MLPSSHENLMIAPEPRESAMLAEAFSEFIAASGRLELSYRDLQAEVSELSLALAERNRALQASLLENRSLGTRLQRILEAIPCGVLVVDEEGAVRLANPEAARLLALTRDDTAPPPGLRLHLLAGLDLGVSPCEDAFEEEQEICWSGEAGPVWLAIRRVPLPQATGAEAFFRPVETVLTLRDISVRKGMEREREAAREAVALAQVSALLAHEIRNPLASLELFAGLILDNPERREDWVAHLRAGIRSLSGTVNNVLTLHGGAALPLETVEVFGEAELAVSFLQPMARQADICLTLAAEAGGEVARASFNRSALHQILLNLCTNALRHTPAGGSVRVLVAGDGATATPLKVQVVDTGCGIPQEHLARLFEVGFSGSGATCGLGLAVCDRLVRQLGALLSVRSRIGRGTTFTLEMARA